MSKRIHEYRYFQVKFVSWYKPSSTLCIHISRNGVDLSTIWIYVNYREELSKHDARLEAAKIYIDENIGKLGRTYIDYIEKQLAYYQSIKNADRDLWKCIEDIEAADKVQLYTELAEQSERVEEKTCEN